MHTYTHKHAHRNLFAPDYVNGVLDGLWYSIVTMATVGYGDKVTITGLGKVATICKHLACVCVCVCLYM